MKGARRRLGSTAIGRVAEALPGAVALLLAAALLLGAAPLVAAASAGGQDPGDARRGGVAPDTAEVRTLEGVIVTVERSPNPLRVSTSAVSHVGADELARFPGATLADALRQVPGVALVDFHGLGRDPQLMTRGFYGGGEVEYVVVLVDGVPLNDVPGGRVRWDEIPEHAVERVEVLRGGSSALWGDAAVGAVVNVITRAPTADADARWSVATGSHATLRSSGGTGVGLFGRGLEVFGALDRTEGFREHSDREVWRAGARYALVDGGAGGRTLTLSALTHRRELSEPGPLLGEGGEGDGGDRRASAAYHRFDRASEWNHRGALHGRATVGARGELSGAVGLERRSADAVGTVRLAPEFADTKARGLETTRLMATPQLAVDGALLEDRDRLVVGMELSRGALESEYRQVAAGPAEAYLAANGSPGELDAAGRGRRNAAALFAQYTWRATDAVRFTAGVRADRLADRFEPTVGDEEPAEEVRVTHRATSPKVGLNVRWLDTATQAGHLYLSAGRSFKAPTLDQLFDQRSVPVPFPPYAVSPSNVDLAPQRGRHLELGLYHGAVFAQGDVRADLSLSVYRMDMRDELDFDLETLRYVNLGESRHDGVEGGLELVGPRGAAAFVNVTVQRATVRGGDFDGRQLKAIPRQVVNVGVSGALPGGVEAALRASHARGVHLDDANTIELPAFTRADLRLSRPVGGFEPFAEIGNLLDTRFSTTGYPDPGGADAVYYFPAAGRTFQVGVRSGR